MGWQDRQYAQGNYGGGGGRAMFGGFMWPRITPMVKKLLIANAIVFVAVNIFGIRPLYQWGVFVLDLAVNKVQLWRFVTYQYLHDGAWHILLNMLGLYFLGSLMEQRWGGRKFLLLYTLFGIVGAMLYALLSAVGITQGGVMIGASGSVLGLVGACAVAAPQVMVILFIFPVPIRTAAIILGAVYLLKTLGAEESRTADACHFGGLAAGALWAWLETKGVILRPNRVSGEVGPSGRKWVQVKVRKGAWEKKLKRQQARQAEIDRILQKIHEKGLNSLSRGEKKLLQDASKDKR